MTQMPETSERSYGCSYGCGNPYDVVVVIVEDATTSFLCIPCFLKLSADILQAITDGSNPEIMAKLALAQTDAIALVPGPGGKRRGKNAPAETDDPDLIAAYDDVVTVDDLSDEFR